MQKIALKIRCKDLIKSNEADETKTPDTSVCSLLTRAVRGGLLASQAVDNISDLQYKADVAYSASAQELLAYGSNLPMRGR